MIQGYKKTSEDLLKFLGKNNKVAQGRFNLTSTDPNAIFYAEQNKENKKREFIIGEKFLKLETLSYDLIVQFDSGLVRMIVKDRIYLLEFEHLKEKGQSLIQKIRKQPASYKKFLESQYAATNTRFYFAEKVIDKEVDINSFLENFMEADLWIEEILREVVEDDIQAIYKGEIKSQEGYALKPTLNRFNVEKKIIFRYLTAKSR